MPKASCPVTARAVRLQTNRCTVQLSARGGRLDGIIRHNAGKLAHAPTGQTAPRSATTWFHCPDIREMRRGDHSGLYGRAGHVCRYRLKRRGAFPLCREFLPYIKGQAQAEVAERRPDDPWRADIARVVEARVSAACAILDRTHGRPRSAPDAAPLHGIPPGMFDWVIGNW